jgi:hypothetical protein
MSLNLLFLICFGVIALLVLVWALRNPQKRADSNMDAGSLEEADRRHVAYFPQVRQAMAATDYEFLRSRGSRRLAQRVHNERRKIALAYLAFLSQDFERLLRLARVIAVLSPEVWAAQEFERFRLSTSFSLKYGRIRMKLLLGYMPLPEIGSLSEAVSKLTIRLETAMRELGERAALAAELASSLDRSRVDT